MKHTVFKIFTVAQHEQEEQWLNEMSNKGLQLFNVGLGYYVFENGSAGEYQYKIELLPNSPSHSESLQYISFLRDMGIECVASYMRWVYFRKKADGAEFVLYSDIPSNIRHYERVLGLCRFVYILNFIAGFMNLVAVIEQIADGPTGRITLNAAVVFLNLIIGAVVLSYSRPMRHRLKQMRMENAVRE